LTRLTVRFSHLPMSGAGFFGLQRGGPMFTIYLLLVNLPYGIIPGLDYFRPSGGAEPVSQQQRSRSPDRRSKRTKPGDRPRIAEALAFFWHVRLCKTEAAQDD
jgi:hypothetical protein